MSYTDGTGVRLFPTEFIKKCIKQYETKRGKTPKVLVVSMDDWTDYNLSCSLPAPQSLGLETITYGEYLEIGEIDLAMAIKNPE